MIPNHTSDLHPWFQHSRVKGANSPLTDWYIWHEGRLLEDGSREPPSNWVILFHLIRLFLEVYKRVSHSDFIVNFVDLLIVSGESTKKTFRHLPGPNFLFFHRVLNFM